MKRIRVDVKVVADTYEVSLSCADPVWQATPRTLARDSDSYPVPPPAESAQWQGGAHAKLCDIAGSEERSSLHQRVLIDPAADEIETFGRYLFQVLCGSAWAEMLARFPDESFGIELHIAPEASFLDALPWELMWNDRSPLIASNHTVARIVERKDVAPTPLETPLRVLFVVGELDDELRPGAEYLEILHSLGRNGSNGTRIPGATLPVRSIVNADARQVSEAVDKYSPQVVHFVAHGLVNDDNDAVIRLTRRDNDKVVGSDLCKAQRLLELMTPGGKAPPPIVVMNACHSAGEIGVGGARALAADLVRGGVSAAIGMAGEVASNACRLFARAFYRTLAEQEPTEGDPNPPCPIQKAVASGQRAARRFSTESKDNVEWARPSLFVATGASFPVIGNPAREKLIRALANIGKSSRQMFGRTAAMREYEEFIGYRGIGAKRVLAYAQSVRRENLKEVDERPYPYKLGKTTLLAHLQARALLDGYVPCLIPSYHQNGPKPPPNLLYLSLRLAEVMDDMRETFDVQRRVESFAQGLIFAKFGKAARYSGPGSFEFDIAYGEVKEQLKGSGIGATGIDPIVVERAIREDIGMLVKDIRQRCPEMDLKGVLIMLDDLHLYKGYYEHVLQFVQNNPYALGTKEAPAPLVITFEDYEEEGKRIADMLGKLHGLNEFAKYGFITPFESDAEGLLAYSQCLLANQMSASRGKSMKQRYDQLLRHMHDQALGVPSFLKQALVVARFVAQTERPCPVSQVDDEAIFLALQDEQ